MAARLRVIPSPKLDLANVLECLLFARGFDMSGQAVKTAVDVKVDLRAFGFLRWFGLMEAKAKALGIALEPLTALELKQVMIGK